MLNVCVCCASVRRRGLQNFFWIRTIISESVHWGNMCCTTACGGSCHICSIWPLKLQRILWSCGISDADWTGWYHWHISGVNSTNPQGKVNGLTCCKTPKTWSLQDHHTLPKRNITQKSYASKRADKPSLSHLWPFSILAMRLIGPLKWNIL